MTRTHIRRSAAIALASCAALTVAIPAGQALGPRCSAPAGAKILASENGWKAFLVTRDGGPGAPDLRSYYACARGHEPFRFEHGDTGASSLTDVPAAAIRSRYLAYGRVRKQGLGTARAIVVVRDILTHRAIFLRRAVTKTNELEDFHAVVVRNTATVAWIASNGDGEGVRTYEVRMRDVGGTRLLDSGTTIAKRSLRLTANGVQWKRGGVVRFAELR